MALDGGTRNGHDNNSYYSPYDAKDRDANWNIAELEGIKKKVVDNIPEFGRQAKGLPIINLLNIRKQKLLKFQVQ